MPSSEDPEQTAKILCIALDKMGIQINIFLIS